MTGPVALTGGSGFIGRSLARHLVTRGHRLRALVRRPDPALESLGVETLTGALEDAESLRRLVAGCSAVIHCAGAIKGRGPGDFDRVNREGTERLVAAAGAVEAPPRLLLLSSLAARQPELSPYARSKLQAERALEAAPAPLAARLSLRLPAVYGPGDRATLALFQQLARGLAVLPAPRSNRFSLLFVSDLADAIETLLKQDVWPSGSLELDDGRPGGYAWAELPAIAERSLGRRVRALAIPPAALWASAALSETGARLLGRAPLWTRGKLREFRHPDWTCRRGEAPELAGWRPKVTLDQGLPLTIDWYREKRWL